MKSDLTFTLRSTIFDRPRLLTVSPEYLEFDDKDLKSASPTRFLKDDIESYRYGVRWIRGYRFYIGRIYCIDIRSNSGQLIKLRMKSVYSIKKKQHGAQYLEIVKALVKYYFKDVTSRYLKLFRENIPFEILGLKYSIKGIQLDKKLEIIPWEFVGTKSYRRYYAIFSEIDPNEYKAFEYLDNWNAAVLHGVTEGILKMKFPDRKTREIV